jgi:DUF4097 and DUF4098 domain-containing protein YvlB
MKKLFWRSVLVGVLVVLGTASAMAQKEANERGGLQCNDNWDNGRLENHCEIQEQTMASGGTLNVDARKNGGISMKGWDRNEILVRSRIQTSAPTQAEAAQMAKEIRIQTGASKVFAEGPAMRENYHWSVSYEIFVPRQSDLSLQTYNGGLVISDVSGRIEFTALNGGVVLKRVGGNVKGSTTNGGLVVELSGDRWQGEALDVKTTNGGIVMSVPENYSAHLETGTVNGNLSIDFPVTVQGRITRELAVNLGAGGPMVRATTTNGGVKIKRISFSN